MICQILGFIYFALNIYKKLLDFTNEWKLRKNQYSIKGLFVPGVTWLL